MKSSRVLFSFIVALCCLLGENPGVVITDSWVDRWVTGPAVLYTKRRCTSEFTVAHQWTTTVTLVLFKRTGIKGNHVRIQISLWRFNYVSSWRWVSKKFTFWSSNILTTVVDLVTERPDMSPKNNQITWLCQTGSKWDQATGKYTSNHVDGAP